MFYPFSDNLIVCLTVPEGGDRMKKLTPYSPKSFKFGLACLALAVVYIIVGVFFVSGEDSIVLIVSGVGLFLFTLWFLIEQLLI